MAFWRRIWQRDAARGARRLHRARRRHGVRQGARVRDRRRRPRHRPGRRAASARASSHMQSGTVADIAAVVDNCAVALQEAEEMAGFRPSQVVIGIAGELVKGFTTTHNQERKQPDQPITEAELQKLIDGVQREALREAERAITWETGLPNVDVRLVHAAVTGASIDGYAVTNPVGFQGRHVQIGIFNAFAPLVHLGALQSVAGAARPRAARDRRGAVRRRPGARQRAGPPGRRAVRRRRRRHDRRRARAPGRHRGHADVRARRAGVHEVARRPARPAVPARRGAQGRLRARHRRSTSRDDVATIVGDDVAVWAAGVELVMEELAGGDLLPGRIYLCGGGSRLPEIRGGARAPRRSAKRLPFARPPEVIGHRARPDRDRSSTRRTCWSTSRT